MNNMIPIGVMRVELPQNGRYAILARYQPSSPSILEGSTMTALLYGAMCLLATSFSVHAAVLPRDALPSRRGDVLISRPTTSLPLSHHDDSTTSRLSWCAASCRAQKAALACAPAAPKHSHTEYRHYFKMEVSLAEGYFSLALAL